MECVGDNLVGLIQILITAVATVIASSGYWTYRLAVTKKDTGTTNLLLGLAHDRIVYLALKYIERGFITHDELENLSIALYKPYLEFGGNGSAARLMKEVEGLPLFNQTEHIKDRLEQLKKEIEQNDRR